MHAWNVNVGSEHFFPWSCPVIGYVCLLALIGYTWYKAYIMFATYTCEHTWAICILWKSLSGFKEQAIGFSFWKSSWILARSTHPCEHIIIDNNVDDKSVVNLHIYCNNIVWWVQGQHRTMQCWTFWVQWSWSPHLKECTLGIIAKWHNALNTFNAFLQGEDSTVDAMHQ